METPQEYLNTLSEGLADAVAAAEASVVSVHGRRRLPGTGTVWQAADKTFVVTASHIVEREENLAISNGDGELVAATLLSRDFGTDLAVLRVDDLKGTPITLRTAPARVGNLVLAIGRPFGVTSATFGSITTIGSIRFRHFQTPTLIHAETTPLPGFSGGPLIDATGAAIGINTSGLMRRGRPLGGATGLVTIPTAQVDAIVSDIVEYGHVRYGWVGVSIQQVELPESAREALNEQEIGLLITSVAAGSPAANAGIVVGDILVSMGEQALTDVADLQHLLGGRQIGTPIAVNLLRGGSQVTLEVTPAERPERTEEERERRGPRRS